jgi:aspartate/methionine/tyrosine aminotransferase
LADRRDFRAFHPFARLDRLLAQVPAGSGPGDGGQPILLSVGEPRDQPPDFVAEELTAAAEGWSRYPPPRGAPAYLEAASAWLIRRYGLSADMIEPQRMMLPLPGSREGLFFAALSTLPSETAGGRPVVLIPNPFYHVYAGAAIAAGAEPVFVPATRETGFLPDFAGLDPAVLERAKFCYFCTPSNPQGAAAGLERLKGLIELARRHDFVVAFDECYAEIYTDAPPAGALQAAAQLGGSLDGLLAFHSLSKRSSAPGLRCGFVAGAPDLIDALDMSLRVGGAGVPLPVQAAGARLWRDEDHVVATRKRYQEKFAVAERILGNRFGFRRPDGGFFLWLEVGDGEAAAVELWGRAGLRVLPGAYTSAAGPDGTNPGDPYIRVALVHGRDLTERALERLSEILS